MSLTAGIHVITADAYHADPCARPSLSSSLIKVLLNDSPLHAYTAHPLLNPHAADDEAEHFDIGTVAHAILLEGESAVAIIDAKDWRTNAAKAARDDARAAGKVPLLTKAWADVQAMVLAAHSRLAEHEDGQHMFLTGEPEQTAVWEEDGVWCRARFDWLRSPSVSLLHPDESVETVRIHGASCIDDYKTTGISANPDQWSRTLFNNGCDLQAAWYLRGLKAVTGEDAVFRFAVQETYAPYALSVMTLAPDALALASAKCDRAVALWRQCLTRGHWPAYPTRTAFAAVPAYLEAAWLESEAKR